MTNLSVLFFFFFAYAVSPLYSYLVFFVLTAFFYEFLWDSYFLLPISILDSIDLNILLCVFDLPNALYHIILQVSLSYLHKKIFTLNLFSVSSSPFALVFKRILANGIFFDS